jgi:hypothetical protein
VHYKTIDADSKGSMHGFQNNFNRTTQTQTASTTVRNKSEKTHELDLAATKTIVRKARLHTQVR